MSAEPCSDLVGPSGEPCSDCGHARITHRLDTHICSVCDAVHQVSLLQCPACGLLTNRCHAVQTDDEGWTEWRCWSCGHVFGGICDRGELDLGLVTIDQPNQEQP